MAKLKFYVKSPIKLGGKRIEPGKSVDIDEESEVIEQLTAINAIEPAKKGAKPGAGDQA